MQKPEEKVVHYASPEAAKLTKVEGWLSADGSFWPSSRADAEHMARYCGSTHQKCHDCDEDVAKRSIRCDACAELHVNARFAALERLPWDGNSYITMFDGDLFFSDFDELAYHIEEHACTVESLMLMHCRPNYPSTIDPDDHFCDDLPEDGEVSDALRVAFEALNDVIRKEPPLSWSMGKVAVELSAEQIETLKQLEKGNVDPE